MFDAHVAHQARLRPRAIAVITPRRQVSYADFDADIDRLGAALAARGVTPERGVVSLALKDPYLQYLALAALARLRVISSPANDDRADLRLSDAAKAPAGAPDTLHLSADWISAALSAPRTPLLDLPRDPEATSRVLLSSGTTRTPRRVAFSWRRIDGIVLALLTNHGVGRRGAWVPLTGVDSLMGYGLVIAGWAAGAAILNGVVDIPGWMEALDEGVIGMTPPKLRQIVDGLPDDFTPKPGWRIMVAGSALPAVLSQQARLRLTPDLWVNYGATEASVTTFGPAQGVEANPGYVGVVPPGAEVQIVDEAGAPLPAGVQGEIRIRSMRMASGYIDDPEGTAERFREGWFHPGDLGRLLPEGGLCVDGRVDDRMTVAGRKILPQVLEDMALAMPGVRDAAAFAAPDGAGIDQCWVAIVAAPDLDRAALPARMAAGPGLPPHNIAWIDDIPRNAMGKIERSKLRDILLTALKGATG